jgi:protein-S-isoprenylcysteine O-methyltransferase Ste14
VKKISQFGIYLFQHRAAIAAVFFIVLILFARPISTTIAHIFVVIGIGLRLWAAGYIGPEARKLKFRADHIIVNGPYGVFRHPLYIGNFFLVLGVTILYNPPRWLGIIYLTLFIIMYAMIAISEKDYLKGKPARVASYRFSNLKGEMSTLLVLAVVYVVWGLLIARR